LDPDWSASLDSVERIIPRAMAFVGICANWMYKTCKKGKQLLSINEMQAIATVGAL
jgi:hypothetical protein